MIYLLAKKSAAVAMVACKFPFLMCVALGLLLCQPGPASAAVRDCTIELSGGKIAADQTGLRWVRGTLFFKGKRYPLTVSGVALRSVSAIDYTAAGSVTSLNRPTDINGTYTRIGAGLTLGGGASIAEMRNQKGVTIHLDSATKGLSVSLAATGMKVSILP
jgi:hypothetical protein